MKDLVTELEQRRAQHLYRSRRVIDGPQGTEIRSGGKTLLSFCSNDYLGLANHPALITAMQQAAGQYGAGSGAAHLISGHSAEHHALEEELAAFTGRPRALLFSTGYMANLGVMSALMARGDRIYQDRLNHASLIDGGRLSGARLLRYAHNDTGELEKQLTEGTGVKLIASDGLFSMDGDEAPIKKLAELARIHGAWLMIDDAHGLGVSGQNGRGTLAAQHCSPADVPILMGTLGKALGTFGAFVAGSEELIETLIQNARTYIYTTAPPPAVAAAARAALHLVDAEPWRRAKLMENVQQFRYGAQQLGLPLMDSQSAIQPLLINDEQRALAISQTLLEKNILITAIRPPTVPQGTSRLRITFSTEHSEQQVDRLLSCLADVFNDSLDGIGTP